MRKALVAVTCTAALAAGVGVSPTQGADQPSRPSAPIAAVSSNNLRAKAALAGDAWVIVRGLDSDSDGKPDRVHVHYVLPHAGATNVPVVIEASPYYAGGNDVSNHNVDVKHLYVPQQPGARRSFGSSYANLLRKHDYAYVYAESIGSGGSTGCPSSGGTDETAAMVAVVKWLTGHAKAVNAAGHRVEAAWSSGHVGMIGVSYNGTLANAVASTGVDGLDAIIPISAISSWYDYYRSQGAVRAPGGYQGEDEDVLAKYVLTRAHRSSCDASINQLAHQMGRKTGDYTDFWAARNYRADAANVDAAVLSLHGLSDWNVMSDQTGRWIRALDQAGVPTMTWWHPNSHGDWLFSSDKGWRTLIVDWFDHWLKGTDNGVMARPHNVAVLPSGKHWASPSWPMPAAQPVALYPRGDGRSHGGLGIHAAPGQGTLVDDAAYSVQQLANKAQSRHRLLFETRALTHHVALSGLAHADIAVSFSAKASNLSVGLAEVNAKGHARVISEGWLDPQNHASLAVGEALVPGRIYHLRVDLDIVLQHKIAKGHRLALVIAASDHDYTLRPPPGVTLTIRLHGTSITLPVVGGAL